MVILGILFISGIIPIGFGIPLLFGYSLTPQNDFNTSMFEKVKTAKLQTYHFNLVPPIGHLSDNKMTSNDSYLKLVSAKFTTEEVFAVNNPVKYNFTAITREDDVANLIGVVLDEPNYNYTNLAEANLPEFIRHKAYIGTFVSLEKISPNRFSAIGVHTFTSERQVALFILVNGTKGFEPISNNEPLFTIYPAAEKLQADTNKAIILQAEQTDRQNNLMIGLTLILLGWVPFQVFITVWHRL